MAHVAGLEDAIDSVLRLNLGSVGSCRALVRSTQATCWRWNIGSACAMEKFEPYLILMVGDGLRVQNA